MALRKGTITEIPPGAVRLTPEEAVLYQFDAVKKWKPQSEMWPLMYGSLGVGVTNSLSGVFINECFRRQCLLPKSALFLIGMPIITVSSLAVTFLHHKYVTSDLLLMNSPCMPCVQGRTVLLVGLLGTLYPLIGSSFGSMLQAQRMDTIYLPSLGKETKKFFQTWQQMVQKNNNFLTKVLAVNVIVAVIVAHLQLKAFYRFNQQDH
ncbi:uncharacterized protein LOC130703955 [Daphnia carinata]|uniref:uncharacterized protein LOC130703955 n=1 Tax=Daphnia carinata TaxID=120202 RepID=UPI00257C1B32|nr:uncharacterized protein LOC130703955 [Daphnia carinata]